jgi:hypothetical protein
MVIEVDPESIRLKPRQHKGNVLFCGYANFRIGLHQEIDGVRQVIPFVTLVGSAIKLMGERIHFDPKAEPGKKPDPKTGKIPYFPVWFPRSPESRAVFNAKLARLPEIQQLVQQAVAEVSRRTGRSARGDNNPF